MCSKLAFYYNVNDPNFISKEDIIQASPYIGNWLYTALLYDNNNIKIGTSSANCYVQEDSDGKYLVRHFFTYFINGKGSISWQYTNINEQPDSYFQTAKARITSGTGDYVNANGCLKLTSKMDGRFDIVISYKS
jgi:hypothetical protein